MIKTKGLVLKNLIWVGAVAFFMPNVYAFLARVDVDYAALDSSGQRWWHFSFGRCWAIVIGLVLFVAVFSINFESSEFLYFQF
jgi:F0F1-type ATP synthase assembly protein I